MMIRSVVSAIALLAAWPAAAAPWTSPDAPPVLVNPLIVENKCIGDAGWPKASEMAGRDVRIIFPTDRDCVLPKPNSGSNMSLVPSGQKAEDTRVYFGGTKTNPAHNIWITGGKITAPPPRPETNASATGYPSGPTFRWMDGIGYWEGAHVDMGGTCRDAVALTTLGKYVNGATLTGNQNDANTPKITIVNSILENTMLCGNQGANHGDLVHGQGDGLGSVRPDIKFQNVVLRTGAQGIYVDNSSSQSQVGHGVNRLTFDRVQVYNRTDWTRIPNSGTFADIQWNVAPAQGVYFKDTWLDTGATTGPAQSGFTAAGCATYAASAGVRTSGWCKGKAPAGDPVTPATVGRNYKRSYFTGQTEPNDPPEPPVETGRNRILSKQGFAAINRVLASEFLGQGRQGDVVAYAYREHAKGAAAGSEDICKASGITWGGDVAEDALYITSALSAPADLDVIVGNAPAERVALPANQAEAGQQVILPLGDRVGRPKFALWRDGVKISEWHAKATIMAAPPSRNVSTFAGAQLIAGQPQQQARAWFSAISTDQPEGDVGTKDFVVRVHRDSAAETMTARCFVEAGTATAADFAGGVLPSVDLTLAPNVFTADAAIGVAGETLVEPDETAKVVCGEVRPSSYVAPVRSEFPLLIRNDDTAGPTSRFSIRAVAPSLVEGTGTSPGPVALEVIREGTSTDAASVDICQVHSDASGGQAAASDFVAGLLKQTLPFAAGEMGSKFVEHQVVPDANAEPDEWATFRLLFPSAGSTIATGTANVLLRDDDSVFSAASRINAGAEVAVVDSAGNAWAPDNGAGGATDSNDHDFVGTVDDVLYRTSRYGASSYKLQVVPGVYDVFGLFSEPDASNDNVDCDGVDAEDPADDKQGRRLMVAAVSATGGDSVSSAVIDPYCAAGFRAAHRVRLARVNAPAGEISVALRSTAGSQAVPLVNGIEALRVTQAEPPRAQEWLNLGAPEDARYTDAAANTWRGLPPVMASGCTSVAETAKPAIEGTEADELYWTRCQGADMSFTIPIDTAGGTTRAVNLLFAEMTAPEAARVVDVYVQGALQIADLDVRAASGALKQALIRSVSPVTIGGDGLLRVRVVAKTGAPAVISGISVVEPLVPQTKTEQIGWKSRKKIGKADLIKLLSPTMRSPSGNPLVVRKVDTTNSSVYVCHGACAPTATRGVQPDTEAANNTNVIEIMAHDPGDQTTSMFPSLARFGSTTDSFKVTIAELLPGGGLGVETIVTVNLKINRVL